MQNPETVYFGNKNTTHQSPTFPKLEGLTQLRKDSHQYRNNFIQFHFAVHSLHPFHPVSARPSGSMKRWWMGRAHLTCVDTSNAWKHQSKDHLDMGMVEWCMGKNKSKPVPEISWMIHRDILKTKCWAGSWKRSWFHGHIHKTWRKRGRDNQKKSFWMMGSVLNQSGLSVVLNFWNMKIWPSRPCAST